MILDAILSLNPNAKVVVRGDDVDSCTIEWLDGTSEISKSDIKTKVEELQKQYDNNKYQRDRAAEYPSVVDQLDEIYHNGLDAWKVKIKAVKDANPKG
jgi:hypothetical protein